MTTKAPRIEMMLTDSGAPAQLRVQMLKSLCQTEAEGVDAALKQLLERASAASTQDQYAQKLEEVTKTLEGMAAGPLRMGTFVRPMLPASQSSFGRRAEVQLPDGTAAFCSVPDAKLAADLRCGDTVWLEAGLKAVLFHAPLGNTDEIGEEARLERALPGGRVEIDLREQGRFLYRASARLEEQLECGEAGPGSQVLVCPQRRFAFAAVPQADGLSHLRYVVREPIPDIVPERDIGNPPAFIDGFLRHVEREMLAPDVGRRYRQRRSRTHLLKGVPGTGKTFSILGLWNRMYAVMSAVTGAEIEDLPHRVLRLEPAGVLDRWVGSSDRNIARFFDEIDELSAQTFVGPDGREHELPCLVIAEEIDALARERGGDSIHDRIQSTLLTRLDSNLRTYSDRLVLFLFTTNTPQLVDPAFLRRAGGGSTTFDRMDRATFEAVIAKHLRARPFAGSNGQGDEPLAERAAAELVDWLYAPDTGDSAVAELVFVGEATPQKKRRRDFLTAALVDRAVQQACAEACDAEWRAGREVADSDGSEEAVGLTTALLARAIDDQVRATVDVLTPQNTDRYLTLPDGARVGTVRRLEPPALLPAELERA